MQRVPGATMAQKYPNMAAFQREAAQMSAQGWFPIAVQEHQGVGWVGITIMVCLGIFLTPACVGVFILLSIPAAVAGRKHVNAVFEHRPAMYPLAASMSVPLFPSPPSVPLSSQPLYQPLSQAFGSQPQPPDPSWGTWMDAQAPFVAPTVTPQWHDARTPPPPPAPRNVPAPRIEPTHDALYDNIDNIRRVAERADAAVAHFIPNNVLRCLVYIGAVLLVAILFILLL